MRRRALNGRCPKRGTPVDAARRRIAGISKTRYMPATLRWLHWPREAVRPFDGRCGGACRLRRRGVGGRRSLRRRRRHRNNRPRRERRRQTPAGHALRRPGRRCSRPSGALVSVMAGGRPASPSRGRLCSRGENRDVSQTWRAPSSHLHANRIGPGTHANAGVQSPVVASRGRGSHPMGSDASVTPRKDGDMVEVAGG
jgi:hypothetical protein